MPDGTNKSSDEMADAGKASSPQDRDTGSALRSVYQKTVDEAVPEEMLDLLGKLD